MSSLLNNNPPPLLPSISAILLLDSNDGSRMASKYYGSFLLSPSGLISPETEGLRTAFEKSLHKKTRTVNSKNDIEVTTVDGMTACYRGGSGVTVFMISPLNESELVIAHVLDGFHEALRGCLGGQIDRGVILDNLELLMLLIDEVCDSGSVLECNARELVGRVLMKSQEEMGGREGGGVGDMTIGQVVQQAKEQFIANMGQN
ncbi:hypothetical protein TrCOL_g11790 [Triparma columacea]|uniref:Coatomer subunit zeta n=1 Tax=Triparma columacea TaxID=722753 RepID=A0A9W7GFS1_9STRA|nr:hypothetical protein TrCOL_g11790 [Triparma columacea]